MCQSQSKRCLSTAVRARKLREKGAASLTDEELVAAILGMGTAGIDVRTMSRQVAALIHDYREALTLDLLLSVPGMVRQKPLRFFQL
ncbi:MAG: UPF0758 domain-containing protein, partial [Blastocatellia bacterium]